MSAAETAERARSVPNTCIDLSLELAMCVSTFTGAWPVKNSVCSTQYNV